MSVCYAASIGIQDDAIEYTGPNGAHWRIPLAQVRAVGEYQSVDDDRGTLLVLVFDDSGTWLQAPRNAVGADQLLEALFQRGDSVSLLAGDSTPAGRVLWPAELANEPLFQTEASGRHLSATVSAWVAPD